MVRTEKATHGIKIGDIMKEKFYGRFCRVVALHPYEGSGLVIENGLVEVQDLGYRTNWFLGYGALEATK